MMEDLAYQSSRPPAPPALVSELSYDDLKVKMYGQLQDLGAVDSMKAHMRAVFLTKLHHSKYKGSNQLESPHASQVIQWTLHERIINSLFIDHLRHYDLNHTLSVFLPESHMSKFIFSKEHILDALRFDNESKLYQHMVSHWNIGTNDDISHEILTIAWPWRPRKGRSFGAASTSSSVTFDHGTMQSCRK